MKKIILLCACLVCLETTGRTQTVTDYDGNIYDTVMIGNQSWLKENLKVTHYRNGISIPNIPGGTTWAGITSGARCYYANDSAAYDSIYGPLYNWYAVNNANGICPLGWHVPTDAEWTATELFLGGSSIAGGKMKETGTLHWLTPNIGATNSSGFTGLPGGMLHTSYVFQTVSENGLWWTSTMQPPGAVWSRYLWYMFAGVDRNPVPKTIGLSIRCVKDAGVGLGENEQNHMIKLYPNPAKTNITIEWRDECDVNLNIYNILGENVMHLAITKSNNCCVDVSGFAPGIYSVTLTGGSWSVQKKLIKQ